MLECKGHVNSAALWPALLKITVRQEQAAAATRAAFDGAPVKLLKSRSAASGFSRSQAGMDPAQQSCYLRMFLAYMSTGSVCRRATALSGSPKQSIWDSVYT
jgi:hypothetical protein